MDLTNRDNTGLSLSSVLFGEAAMSIREVLGGGDPEMAKESPDEDGERPCVLAFSLLDNGLSRAL